MSIHNLPAGMTGKNFEAIYFQLTQYIRLPNDTIYANGITQPPTAIEFVPDLTAGEVSTFNGIVSAVQNAPTAQAAALAAWNTLPPYLQSGTVDQFTAFVDNQVFNGQTIAQVTATINSTVVNITTANVAQINAQLGNIRTMLIAAATAIIGIREILKATGKLVIVIRDFTVRFTKFMLGIFGFR